MPATNCSVCGVQSSQLRTVHLTGTELELCPQCRWKQEHKCQVKGCTTPASKVKLKNIPGRLLQATEAVRGEIFSKFGIHPSLQQCCKSCFTKLHRAIAEYAANSSSANTAAEVPNNKGRPTVSYENASTKTKRRIEKKAHDLLNKTLSDLKENYNSISGGCGEQLLNTTLQTVTTQKGETTKKVKPLK